MSRVSECGQNKKTSKNTDVCMFYIFICPTFTFDMIMVFNKIINNSLSPAWYFSLTRMGSKEFIIVCWPYHCQPIFLLSSLLAFSLYITVFMTVCLCMYVHVSVCMHVSVSLCVSVSVSVCVCICVCVC